MNYYQSIKIFILFHIILKLIKLFENIHRLSILCLNCLLGQRLPLGKLPHRLCKTFVNLNSNTFVLYRSLSFSPIWNNFAVLFQSLISNVHYKVKKYAIKVDLIIFDNCMLLS